LVSRQIASFVRALRDAEGPLRAEAGKSGKQIPSVIEKGFEIVHALMADEHPAGRPIQAPIGTEGEWLSLVVDTDFQSLLSPMDVKYVHGLHRITMMGILPANQIGRWRKRNVHVGNPDIDFPPPETVDSLMVEFRNTFPPILPKVNYEPMMVAAKTSYRFVRIHPYVDGNGRMSRLIMNLILQGHHPMVSLAPRAKERHRYRQAIRRADRGKIEPLAALVAISVRDTYERMLEALIAR
jgi:Fic family protein